MYDIWYMIDIEYSVSISKTNVPGQRQISPALGMRHGYTTLEQSPKKFVVHTMISQLPNSRPRWRHLHSLQASVPSLFHLTKQEPTRRVSCSASFLLGCEKNLISIIRGALNLINMWSLQSQGVTYNQAMIKSQEMLLSWSTSITKASWLRHKLVESINTWCRVLPQFADQKKKSSRMISARRDQ